MQRTLSLLLSVLPLWAAANLAAQVPAWHTLAVAPQAHAVAWDAARNRLLMIGPSAAQRMWEWDGVEVRERLLAMQGQPLVWQATYDPRLQQVVAIGEGPQRGNYWVGTWQGAGWTWRTGGTRPDVDDSATIAFDHLRARLVLYRGTSSGSTLHEWDGQQWWLVADHQGPAGRSGAAFAFDPIGQRCVLYGGDPTVSARADTWAWDGFAWTLLAAVSAPGPRSGASLGFDPFANRLVLYGGDGADTTTWQLLGSSWTQVATTNSPGPRRGARLFADGQGLLLVGATREQRPLESDAAGVLWRLQGNSWNPIGHLPQPTPRQNNDVAYDRVRQQIVSFGGGPTGSFPIPDQTVVFDRRWRFVAPVREPPPRHGSGLCWSNVDQQVLLFGGRSLGGGVDLADTWTWDGTSWQQRNPSQSPSPRRSFTLAEDPLGGVLLFGGTDGISTFDEHWWWDGITWQQLTVTPRPGPRSSARAALDPVSHRVVLFGGAPPDTWLWDGAAWTQVVTAVVPTFVASMAFRPESQRVTIASQVAYYEWTGSDWQVLTGLGTASSWTRLVSDPVRGQLLDVQPPRVAVLTSRRAAVERFGNGCALGAIPTLDAIDEPTFGAGFALELGALAAGAPVFLVVGLGAQNQPFGSGCSLLVAQTLASNFALTSSGGVARFSIPVPDDPRLRSLQFTAQGVVFDPSHSMLGTFTATAGLRCTVGD